MQSINATKFKEQCLSLLDHLSPEGIVITKRGKPLAKLIPLESDCAWATFCQGARKGDPADQIIAATSIVHRVPLLTRDRTIRASKRTPLA